MKTTWNGYFSMSRNSFTANAFWFLKHVRTFQLPCKCSAQHFPAVIACLIDCTEVTISIVTNTAVTLADTLRTYHVGRSSSVLTTSLVGLKDTNVCNDPIKSTWSARQLPAIRHTLSPQGKQQIYDKLNSLTTDLASASLNILSQILPLHPSQTKSESPSKY